MKSLDLKDQWLTLWRDLSPQGNPLTYYELLRKRYTEPHRYYHNLHHIDHDLTEYMSVRQRLNRPHEVEMAIWFHDAIYEIGSFENEAKSATLALTVINEIALPRAFGLFVRDLILVTEHRFKPQNDDASFMADIDLSFFGQPTAAYDQDEMKIRKEHAIIPEAAYKIGRAAILRSFLNRSSIYYTTVFREKYETQARSNLQRTLTRLAN